MAIENDNNIILKSLSPSDNAKNIEKYKKFLDKALSEEKNKNIALTGNYASGKSSILQTYFKNDDKTIYISLGSYFENEFINYTMDDIETSILQQILYKVRPNRLPLSRLHRIDFNYNYLKKYNYIISFIITIILIIIFELFNIDKLSMFLNNSKILTVVFSIIMSFLYLIVLYVVKSINNNFSFKKMTINGVELDKEESDISILNRNIEELIHFFYQTNFNKIIFEDIDRLEDYSIIFSKLKEINMILNNALGEDIQFIYAVSDTIFENSEKRTKFFDIIIPIVPYSSFEASKDLFFSEEFSELNLDKDIIKELSHYIDNPRIVYDIINEYSVYKEVNIINNKKDLNSLFVLCAYKSLYPVRFKNLLENKGWLAYYFSKEFENEATLSFKTSKEQEIKDKNKTSESLPKEDIDKLWNELNSFNIKELSSQELLSQLEKSKLPLKFKFNEKESKYDLNSFEEWIITSKIVSNSYRRLIITRHNDYLSDSDENILDLIVKDDTKGIVDYNYSFSNVKDVFEELSIYDFKNDSVCIEELFIEMLKSNRKEKCLQQFYYHISEYKVKFILKLENDNDSILKKSASYLDVLVKYVANNTKRRYITLDFQERIYCAFIAYSRKGDDKIDAIIYSYFSNVKNIEDIFHRNYYNFIKQLKYFDISLNQKSFKLSPMYKDFYDYIIENDLYGFNFNFISSALKCKKVPFDMNKILESSYYLKDVEEKIYNKIYNNLDVVLRRIQDLYTPQKDTEDFLRILFSDEKIGLTDNNKLMILKFEDILIKDIKWVPTSLYTELLKEEKIEKKF